MLFRRTVVRMCSGGVPPTRSPAAQDLAQRLQSKGRKDPAKAVKLIDKLKDLQLQGHWAKAVALFDNHPESARQWRWQSFHYRCVLQLLLDAKQPTPLERLWAEMKLRPEIAIEQEVANDALALAALGNSDALVADIQREMETRGFELKPRAVRGLERRRAADWAAGLKAVQDRIDLRRFEGGKAGAAVDDPGLQAAFDDLLRAHRRNGGAVAAIHAAMTAAGVPPSATAGASRIRHAASWEEALALLQGCREASAAAAPRTADAYNEALGALWAKREAARMPAVIAAMAEDSVAHNRRTVELVMRYYETTPKWAEATEYFLSMKAAGVPPTNGGYGALIKAYNRGGQAARVMPVFEAMRKDGFQGDARDTVSLINAWSSNRAGRFRQG